ncbi:MAG: c-type cytochrome [Bacteroidales bacterium]|nr:c-type cytochrome [Bacteroidales bacterium]
MTGRISFRTGAATTRTTGVCLALFLLMPTGCGSSNPGYEATLRYPARTQPLVLMVPTVVPTAPAAPGQLDAAILALRESGGRIANPKSLPENPRTELQAIIETLFGTPAAPTVNLPAESAPIPGLDLSAEKLAAGSRLYKRLCVQCHGLAGDARGPTGPFLYPYPRDFRQGVFKAIQNPAGQGKLALPDLGQLIRHGVPGTSMPAFDQLTDTDVQNLTGYTVHLSLRGEVEFRLLKALLDDGEDGGVDDIPAEARRQTARIWEQWRLAQEPSSVPVLPDSDEAITRGFTLFTAQSGAGCLSCHEDFGRKDVYRYDVWGGVNRVRDLTKGEFRWGADPESLTRRIRHGILAAGMPANPNLTDEQVRDLRAFVQALPYPPRLPPDLRAKIYPGSP